VNPKTGKIEQLPYETMSRERKPELYFRHRDVINQTQLDKASFSLYLHENMLDFFTDIGEIANCLEVYSHSDACEALVTYSYDVRSALCDGGVATAIHSGAAGAERASKLDGRDRVQPARRRSWEEHARNGQAPVL